MSKKALLVIDLQAGIKMVSKHAYPLTFNQVVEKNKELIQRFINEDQFIVLVSVRPANLPKLVSQRFTKLAIDGFSYDYDKLFEHVKYGGDAFGKSEIDLDMILKHANVTKLYISGISTSNGVLKTALTALNLGYQCFVLEDACADLNKKKHDQAINELKDKVSVTSTSKLDFR